MTEHNRSIRCVQDAEVAILFVHGILGTPNHFAPFLPLVPPDWTVCNLLLKGHGGGVKDFSAASMAEWKQQVHQALQTLRANHSKIIIVAHSMGTLFAIQEAIQAPVTALFLLNAPLKLHIRLQLLKTTWKVFRGNIQPDDVRARAAQNAYSIEEDPHILRYIGWIPRYIELFAEIRRTRKIVHRLAVPCRLYLSLHDEMVSPKSAAVLKNNACVTVKFLRSSGHCYYAPKDLRLLRHDFYDMVQVYCQRDMKQQ